MQAAPLIRFLPQLLFPLPFHRVDSPVDLSLQVPREESVDQVAKQNGENWKHNTLRRRERGGRRRQCAGLHSEWHIRKLN